MNYELSITESGKRDLLRLERMVQKRIVAKLRFFMNSGRPLDYAKKLTDSRFGTYRFRIGDYRVIFDVDSKKNIHILLILRVKHRKEIYM